MLTTQYAVLTGLPPFYDECRSARIGDYTGQGKRSFLDPRWGDRSYAEGELAKLVRRCWEQNPEDRIRAGALVTALRTVQAKQAALESRGAVK